MRVTRLEVFGFKSFMDRMVLPVNAGITGVVGPNGCGKSNIVDALRWVLGETRARNLRGAIAEDVIFNGTEKLRPLGLAEVSLTLTAQNQNFFEDILSPGLEADSLIQSVEFDSELDTDNDKIIDDVMASVSTEGAVIDDSDKKQVDAEANAEINKTEGKNSRPRLTVLDGGAESSNGQGSKDDSKDNSKERDTRANSLADKFSWLRATNEVQVTRRLYRSGESEYFINRVPCRLKDMVDLFRAVSMGARAYNVVAQGEISRIVTAKPDEKRTIIEEAAGVLGFRDRIAATNRRLKETETSISRIDDIVKEVSRNVGSLKRQAAKAKNRESLRTRIVELEGLIYTDRYVRLDGSVDSLSKDLEQARSSEGVLEAALDKVQAEENDVRSKLMGIDVESDTIRAKIDSIREDLNNRERERQAQKSRLQELVILGAAAETEIKRLKERETILSERKGVSAQTISTLSESEEQVSKEILGIETGSNEDLKKAAEELEAARESLRLIDQEIRSIREKLVGDESRLGALNEQIKAASPATKLKETLSDEGREYLSRSKGLFVDGIKVPEKYAKAIQSVLAERASFLVSDDLKNLTRSFALKALNDNSTSKKGLAIGIFKAGQATPSGEPTLLGSTLQSSTLKGYCTDAIIPALDVVELSAGFELAGSNLLCDVYCAQSITDAESFLEKIATLDLTSEPLVVTADGDILTRYSFFSCRNEGGLVQLKNQIINLEESTKNHRVKLEELNTEKELRQGKIQTAHALHQQILKESQERAKLVKELSQKLGSARGRLQSEQRLNEQIDQDIAKTVHQTREVYAKISKFKEDQEILKAQINNEISDEERALQDELSLIVQQSSGIEAKRREGRAELSTFTDKVIEVRKELDAARSTVSQATLGLQKVELETAHLKELITEHLGAEELQRIVGLSNEDRQQCMVSDEQVAEYQDEVGKLKSRMIREGEVDPTSIERCEEETKRLEDLEIQKIDLEAAYRTLRRTVERLIEISQERFISTFEAVNKNFSELVPKIFGGGSARLELTDPANPLESGVEIIARPPGKKLKSIELLSGGEKTLCAISLIIAMFLERPSPICVLDEVDAPLDEANVVRFLSFVKEMSTKTQFLLITHNKQTMSVCDHLVGVTMEQPGASKIVTVSLEEAYSHAVNG